MSEYNDCLQRAERLAVAPDNIVMGDVGSAVMAVKPDDMYIYARWLISHLHATKRFKQFLKVPKFL